MPCRGRAAKRCHDDALYHASRGDGAGQGNGRHHGALLLAGTMLLLLLCVGTLALKSRAQAGPSAAPAVVASPTVDPRLVLYQRRVALAAALTHGLWLTGVMAPDLPGHNTFDVALRGPGASAHARELYSVAVGQHARYAHATPPRRADLAYGRCLQANGRGDHGRMDSDGCSNRHHSVATGIWHGQQREVGSVLRKLSWAAIYPGHNCR